MRKKNGGKVIASGGFGCVFRPSLKCKGETTREKNKITKLMLKKYAIEEYEDVIKYEDTIKKIPDYQKYFLIDGFKICDPASLNGADLMYFKEKCSALPKKDIDRHNINHSLDKLLALNMPDGGLALDDFIEKNTSYSIIVQLNNCLINLLINGIIPMNKLHIYHCDIKDSNVLVDKNENQIFLTRLIDWGLSTMYIPGNKDKIPKTWHNRPFQFNTPFSIVIFSDKFNEKYKEFLKLNPREKINKKELKDFIVNFIYYWLRERGHGHFKFINSIMYKLFFQEIPKDINNIDDNKVKNKFIEQNYTIPYITNYIFTVLVYFTDVNKEGTISFDRYLNELFIKIVDIYGFIICYYPILEIYYQNFDYLNENEIKIFNIVKKIFIHYLYEPRIEAIDIHELKKTLQNLNPLFEIEEKLHSKTFSIMSKSSNFSKKKKSSSFKTRKNRIVI